MPWISLVGSSRHPVRAVAIIVVFTVLSSTGDVASGQTPSEESPAHIEIRTLRNQLKRIGSAIDAGDLENKYRIDAVARDVRKARASVEKVRAKDPSFDIAPEIGQLEGYEQIFAQGSAEVNKEEDLRRYFTSRTHLFHKLTLHPHFHSGYDFRQRGEEYLAVVQAFDTAGLRSKTEEAKAFGDGAFYDLEEIHRFLEADYPRFVTADLQPVVNRHIEATYAHLESQPAIAFDYAQAAVQVCDAVLQVLPGHGLYTGLRADAEKALQKAGADFQQNVLSSAYHREHQRRIVFATRPIEVGREDAAGIQQRFIAGEAIYARAYLDRKLRSFARPYEARIKVFLDDNPIYNATWYLSASQLEESTLDLEITPDPAYRRHAHGVAITNLLAKMSPRRHQLKVVLASDIGEEWAVGELELDASTGLDRLAERSRSLAAHLLDDVEIPAPAMRNAGLEREMVRLAGQRLEAPWTVARVVIRDPDWRIERHPLTGVIVQRLLSTWVVLRGDGRCRMVSMSFIQPWTGSSYGRTEDHGVGESKDVGCDKLR